LDKQAKNNTSNETKESNQSKIDKKNVEDLLDANAKKLKGKIEEDSENLILDQDLKNSFMDAISIVNNQQQNDLAVLWSTNSVDYLAYYTSIGNRIRDVVDII
jgi:hypothetical protein